MHPFTGSGEGGEEYVHAVYAVAANPFGKIHVVANGHAAGNAVEGKEADGVAGGIIIFLLLFVKMDFVVNENVFSFSIKNVAGVVKFVFSLLGNASTDDVQVMFFRQSAQ